MTSGYLSLTGLCGGFKRELTPKVSTTDDPFTSLSRLGQRLRKTRSGLFLYVYRHCSRETWGIAAVTLTSDSICDVMGTTCN